MTGLGDGIGEGAERRKWRMGNGKWRMENGEWEIGIRRRMDAITAEAGLPRLAGTLPKIGDLPILGRAGVRRRERGKKNVEDGE